MNVLSRISVYYDGLCPLCSREIAHYRTQKGQENLYFIDITAPEFKAEVEGLDPYQIHKVMHVRNSEGHIKTGLDAFITIWENLPQYFWLGELAKKSRIIFRLLSKLAICACRCSLEKGFSI